MEKTSKVTKVNYDKPWNAPNGDIIYYHSVELENGDIGNVGVSEKFPPKISQGAEITYTIKGNSIKLLGFSTNQASAKPKQEPTQNQKTFEKKPFVQSSPTWQNKNISRKNPEDYLGFVYGYAKDITIALINNADKKAKSDPVGVTNKMAEEFYNKIKELLGQSPPSEEKKG